MTHITGDAGRVAQFQAFMSQSNGINGGIETVRLSLEPRDTREQAEADCSEYEARCFGRGESPNANWVEPRA